VIPIPWDEILVGSRISVRPKEFKDFKLGQPGGIIGTVLSKDETAMTLQWNISGQHFFSEKDFQELQQELQDVADQEGIVTITRKAWEDKNDNDDDMIVKIEENGIERAIKRL